MISIISQLVMKKVMEKIEQMALKKAIAKNQNVQEDMYYVGKHLFGLEQYVSLKVPIIGCYFLAAIIICIGFLVEDEGIIYITTGILFALLMWFVLQISKNRTGIIFYTNNYLKIIRTKGDPITLSISELKEIRTKGGKLEYIGQEGSIKIMMGGYGFANFMDFLNEKRPELIQPLFRLQNIVFCYNMDRQNGN